MEPNEVTAHIIDAAYRIHKSLGPGLLETVYEVALAQELRRRGMSVRRQVSVPIEYEGLKFDEGFRMDLLVDESIIVEIKSVEKNHPVHPKQLRTHLVLAKLQLGLVLNFGLERMKEASLALSMGFQRIQTLAGKTNKKDRAETQRTQRGRNKRGMLVIFQPFLVS